MNRYSACLLVLLLATFSLPDDTQAQSIKPSQRPSTLLPAVSELDIWQSARRDDRPDSYKNYLRLFPSGTYAAIASTRTQSPLLTDMLPIAPDPANRVVQTEMAAARDAWDNAAWMRVKAANTHAAYREYLSHLPTGLHSSEAITAYEASLPANPSARLAECSSADLEAVKSQGADLLNAYPAYAIERWSDGIVIGKSIVDYSGQVLGATIAYSSNLSMFGNGARTFASQVQYTPAQVNCANVPDTRKFVINYLVGDRPYESRENSEGPPLQATVNTKMTGQLPGDRAVLVGFTPTSGTSVYEIEFQSRFPPLLTQVISGRQRPQPLASNKLFVTSSAEPITLRVSSLDKPNSRRQNMGSFNMIVRQVFNQPDPQK
jgi:hypothetical protein